MTACHRLAGRRRLKIIRRPTLLLLLMLPFDGVERHEERARRVGACVGGPVGPGFCGDVDVECIGYGCHGCFPI